MSSLEPSETTRNDTLISKSRRLFFVGVNTGYVEGGLPDARCREFYANRSGNGLDCAIVGNTVIPGGFGSNQSSPEISRSPAWGQLAEAIRSKGALPGIQLATAWKGYSGQRKFVSESSMAEIARCKRIANDISLEDVKRLFVALRSGTKMAIDVGFRHIQLHAAHGYLFSLLLDGRIYAEADVVAHMIREWAVWASRQSVETSLRFSIRTGDDGFDSLGQNQFLDGLALLPVNYLDVSSGFYNVDKRLIYPSTDKLLNERKLETIKFAQRHSRVQFIYSGKSALTETTDLPENVHIGICRDLIANPNYLRNRTDRCVNGMKCHWYSRGRDHLECSRWKKA